MGDVDRVNVATLPVSEVYGPVYQGEGPHTGRRAYFVRLGLCNLHCSWCDTPYTWDTSRFNVAAECPPTAPAVVAAQITDPDALVVLTGGEPLIHQRTPALLGLLDALPNVVHVETNGTHVPTPLIVDAVQFFSVSPKVHDQGDPWKRRINPEALAAFAHLAAAGHAAFKVVCRDAAEVEEAASWADRYGIARRHLWVMPEGTDSADLIRRAGMIEQAALDQHVNMTLRTHVILHGSERLR